MSTEIFVVGSLDFVRDLLRLVGMPAAFVCSIEVDGEVTILIEGQEPPARIRRRIEAENREDSPDGFLYPTHVPRMGEQMKTVLVSCGRMHLGDMHGVEAAPTTMADGPVRLQYHWPGGDRMYEVSLGQLADLLVEITREARR